jgi:holo-[acyl-carrier protein] synthase
MAVYRPEFDPEKVGEIAVGLDVIEIDRIAEIVRQHGDRFLRRIYTEQERERYASRIPELAARFAAKEATSKALGTGIRGLTWRDMEILSNRRGKPILVLHGGAAARAESLGLVSFDVSLTHSRTLAMAFVVGLKERSPAPADEDGEGPPTGAG